MKIRVRFAHRPTRSIQFHPGALLVRLRVCRDLVASRRRQHIVFGRRRLKLIVRRDEQDREARRVGGRTRFWRSLVMLTFR